uniref:tRNA uridine-5-carboxymethylaminomethyl(34) synthesis enzyme MnmG n=1 Tax=uncultured Porphyromonas sp. TaxID=159274 RepID=UPI00262E9307
TDRMKTGTPMRIDGSTVDYSLCQEQEGEEGWYHFSYDPNCSNKELPHRSCYITYTNEAVHQILREHLDEAPLYNGQIVSIGPRYCPSIETKIVTFAERDHHQIFIEPEGCDTSECYINGFSSSMPYEVQELAIRQIPALRNVHILRPGYAIEYDFFDPTQLHHTMETKLVKGLYFAGQINGTTGYEEAAGQGLIAGINAHLSFHVEQPFVLKREEAYIGVMVDDLVTKGVDEPYRMFTSRAEYRILLRQDNADERLIELGFKIGLVSDSQLDRYHEKIQQEAKLRKITGVLSLEPSSEVNNLLLSLGSQTIQRKTRLKELIVRPGITYQSLRTVCNEIESFYQQEPYAEEAVESVEILYKYDGYIKREQQLADKAKRLEGINIEGRFDYPSIHSLSIEARQKLEKIQPTTIGQASRIPGISPSDINILLTLIGR